MSANRICIYLKLKKTLKNPKKSYGLYQVIKYLMDNKQIKDFITQVAEIKELKPVTDGSRPPDDSTVVLYKGEWINIDRYTNPTLGFKFLKLKEILKPCEIGCGKQIANQVIERKMYVTPIKHWRTKCNSCGKYKLPDGSGFINGGANAQNAFIKFYNKVQDK